MARKGRERKKRRRVFAKMVNLSIVCCADISFSAQVWPK
jgi:hypothetical protein